MPTTTDPRRGPAAAEPLIRSFSSFEEASAAREAVRAAGIARDCIELRVLDDEAGPVEGNFLVGNGRTSHGRPPGPVLAGPDVPYEDNFHDTVRRGAYLLVIGGQDRAGLERARAALDRFDTAEPQPGSPA